MLYAQPLTMASGVHASTRLSFAPIMKDVTVCTGGVCARNGAKQLYSALCVLSAEAEGVNVKTAFCSSECPGGGAMLSPQRGRIPAYVAPCKTASEAVASAEEALQQGKDPIGDASPDLKSAFLLQQQAEAAVEEGNAEEAARLFSSALALVPPALLEPSQPPLEPEELVWDASEWTESQWSSELVCSESLANFEFATCGAAATLVDCALDDADEDRPRLTGSWESTDGGGGDFDIVMSGDGRRFVGTITDDVEGEAKEWSGVRKLTRRVGQRPSARILWLHTLLVRLSEVQLAAGMAEEAVESAVKATRLCCLAASGWMAYAAALEAAGDEAAATDARWEADWLK